MYFYCKYFYSSTDGKCGLTLILRTTETRIEGVQDLISWREFAFLKFDGVQWRSQAFLSNRHQWAIEYLLKRNSSLSAIGKAQSLSLPYFTNVAILQLSNIL